MGSSRQRLATGLTPHQGRSPESFRLGAWSRPKNTPRLCRQTLALPLATRIMCNQGLVRARKRDSKPRDRFELYRCPFKVTGFGELVGRQWVERERVCFLYSDRIRALLVAGFSQRNFSQRNNARMFRPATAEHDELRA